MMMIDSFDWILIHSFVQLFQNLLELEFKIVYVCQSIHPWRLDTEQSSNSLQSRSVRYYPPTKWKIQKSRSNENDDTQRKQTFRTHRYHYEYEY